MTKTHGRLYRYLVSYSITREEQYSIRARSKGAAREFGFSDSAFVYYGDRQVVDPIVCKCQRRDALASNTKTRVAATPTLGLWFLNKYQLAALHPDPEGRCKSITAGIRTGDDEARASARPLRAPPEMLGALETAATQTKAYCAGDDSRDANAHAALQNLRNTLVRAKGGKQ